MVAQQLGEDVMSDRIVITGLGLWTCFGRGTEPLLSAMRRGDRGFRPVRGMLFDDHPFFPTKMAMQIEPEPPSMWDNARRAVDWPSTLAVETALDAYEAAEIPAGMYDKRRVGVLNGTSHGANHGLLEFVRQRVVEGRVPDASLVARSASWVGRSIAARINARGVNLTINTACSSGLNAFGLAARLLRSHRIDCALAGGNDTFSLLSFAGFSSLRAIDPNGCQPFDVQRQGMSLGDGAAYCVLERESEARSRGARILAAITGYRSAGDGHHATAPDPEGKGAMEVMSSALAEDGHAEDLALVSAHGTGTPANDSAELRAISSVVEAFAIPGPIHVSSIKSQVGHTLGAAGAIQVIAAILCMHDRLVPGTIGLRTPLSHTPPLNLPKEPQAGDIPLALCNSLGFGGSVASLCLRRINEPFVVSHSST